MLFRTLYQLVPSSESSHSDNPLKKYWEKTYRPSSKSFILKHGLTISFLVSFLLNVIFALLLLGSRDGVKLPNRSKFAGIARTIPQPWTLNNLNETAQDELWEQTNYDRGNIALDDEYAKAMELPRAQRFPWDSSKGIYLINAYHNLHCVKTLRTAFVEFRVGAPQSSPWLHIVHCLNVLRSEIICDADDTPRYTGFQPQQKSGLGQIRMCRDWKQLEAWAEEHTACWRHVGDISEPGFRELDRYRFCPPGSAYEEMAKTKWLHDDRK